jgi:hypothetical protein
MSLPDTAFTHLGPMPVLVVDRIADDERRGECDLKDRVIRISAGYTDAAQMQTLGHELAHAILWDAGAQHSLTDRQTEIVCDAVGTWFAAAIASGWLAVTPPIPSTRL